MRIIFILTFLSGLYLQLSGQTLKRLLDTSDLRGFKTLMYSRFIISNNGKYIAFSNANSQIDRTRGKSIKSLDNKWERVVTNLESDISFTSDSRLAIFLLKDKHLNIVHLGKDLVEYISDVDSYKILNYSKDRSYLMVDKRKSGDGVFLRDLSTNQEYNYGIPDQFIFSSRSSIVVFNDTIGTPGQSIYYFENGKGKNKIWSGTSKITQMISSSSGNKVAFCTDSDIFYYEKGKTKLAVQLHIPHNFEFAGLKILGQLWFSNYENLLFFRMQQPLSTEKADINLGNKYSYLDGVFDLNASREPLNFDCLYDFRTEKMVRVCYDNEKLESISDDENSLLVSSVLGKEDEYAWNKKGIHKDFVLSLKDNDRVPVKTHFRNNMMAPSGFFVIGKDIQDGDIFCTDVRNKSIYNLTNSLPIPLDGVAGDGGLGGSSRILYWNRNMVDDKLIIYDQYDIWMINLRTSKAPVCLTNGYGRKHHISFKISDGTSSYSSGDEIILSAFNEDNKDAGFYKIKVGDIKDPERLCMGAYQYSQLMKCGSMNRWVVKRMSATEAPNYFWTSDFHNFHQITSSNPEKNYYWYSTELIDYETKDSIKSQAILYKPENFDPHKKYPVLFYFYEKESRRMNEYILPAYTEQFSFNIPMMLSRGYLICVPDIHFKEGETAHSIVDCVEGAADYLSKLSFIDSSHFGACGGSFGGYGVNCLAAFSYKFSAVVPISGVSDFISGYGNVPGLAVDIYETGQCRMGVSLSNNPELYMQNSPVAYANRVKTPILIVNTLGDSKVNVQQGIEWFIALRREGKPVWMLRYKGAEESHGIYILNDQIDLNIRMNQFFDHYLKGGAAPVWMSEGIKAQDGGVRSAYEYNSAILSPPTGLVKDSTQLF